jgi:hypothetical protein
MIDDRCRADDGDLENALTEFVNGLPDLSPETRDRTRRIALRLHARRLPASFILASIRSSAAILTEMEQSVTVEDLSREQALREFVAANTPTGAPASEIDTRKDVKSSERERLRQSIIAAVRDARRSKARHEIKKTRNVLIKIDQRHVRRTLGREGDELCHEINRVLRATAAMF